MTPQDEQTTINGGKIVDKITALTVAEAQNREMMDLIKVSLRDPSISPEKLK